MGNMLRPKCECPKAPCDTFRETPLRLLGYASHLGNVCCAIIPPSLSGVPDMITTAYVTSDVVSKAAKSAEAHNNRSKIAIDTIDALIWQLLATVALPGLIFDQIQKITTKATQHCPNSCKPPPPLARILPKRILKAFPCIVGVLAIPLIRYPVDFGVTKLMDFTYRALLSEEKKEAPPQPPAAAKKAPPKEAAPKKDKK